MKPRHKLWTAALVVLAFVAGALVTGIVPRVHAQAPSAVLPPIFVEGARLLGPTGAVEIREIMGGWIRVTSRGPLAKPGEDLWMHVPGIPGTWLVDARPDETKK